MTVNLATRGLGRPSGASIASLGYYGVLTSGAAVRLSEAYAAITEAISAVHTHAGAAYHEYLSEVLNVAEQAAATLRAVVPVTSLVPLAGSISVIRSASVSSTEIVSLTSSLRTSYGTVSVISDSLTFTESPLAVNRQSFATLAESVYALDSLVSRFVGHSTLTDVVDLSDDAVARMQTYVALTELSQAVTDALASNLACNVPVSDYTTLQEYVGAKLGATVSVEETVALLEALYERDPLRFVDAYFPGVLLRGSNITGTVGKMFLTRQMLRGILLTGEVERALVTGTLVRGTSITGKRKV